MGGVCCLWRVTTHGNNENRRTEEQKINYLTNLFEETFRSVIQSNISANTIRQYIEYLEDAFVINKANRYNVKGRKYIGTPLKYYFEDLALSISLEAAELLEVFQWSGSGTMCESKKDKIREELADVLNYCILMADVCGLDMDEIVQEKIKRIMQNIR